MAQRLRGDAGGKIGNAGNTDDAHAHMACSDGFAGGAHADRVCAEGATHGDFLRGLVLRAGELQINAFHQVDIKAGCGFPCDFLEFKVVDLAHIRETGAELVDVRPDKRRWNEAGDLAV